MQISSDDIAPILTAAALVVTALGTAITGLVIVLRQGRVQREHGAAIAQLKTGTTGIHQTLGEAPAKPPEP